MNEQLAAIRARREAVTPGVWWVDKLQWQCVVSAPNRVIASTHPYSIVHDDEPNAAFIAAAPADIDTLLAHVAALTAERDALAQQLQQSQSQLARLEPLQEQEEYRQECQQAMYDYMDWH